MRTTILFVLAIAACSRSETPAPSPAPAPPPTVDESPGAVGSKDLAGLAGLGAKLHAESQQRPAVKVKAEALFDALATRGIELTSTRQVLAATAAADYCALGVTTESIAVAVCEYSTLDAARAGKRLLDTRYARLVPDAVRALNGTTLLTVANGTSHRDVRDRVLDTFATL